MTIVRATKKFIDNFDRDIAFSAGTANGYWTIKDTSSAGAPTYTTVTTEDGGCLKLLLANTSEAEVVTLYHTDKLFYDLAYLQHVWWIVKVAGVDSVTTLVAGVGSAQNDDTDAIVTNAWFKLTGPGSTTALVVETDDGTVDNDDVATGQTLAAVYKKLHLDFTYGLSDVRFMCDGQRVAAGTTFNMSALTAGLNVQPFLQIAKASGTGVPSVSIAQFGIQYQYAYGA